MPSTDVIIGFKAHLGWLAAVAVRAGGNEPEPVQALRIDLFSDQPRETREPYHVAGGWHGLQRVARPRRPSTVIEQARIKQAALAAACLQRVRTEMGNEGWCWRKAVMLTGRGVLGDLDDALKSHASIHIAEGEAVRKAVRVAVGEMQVACIDQDEKSTLVEAGNKLRTSPEALDSRLKQCRPPQARSWTKEHRIIAAAAWLAASA